MNIRWGQMFCALAALIGIAGNSRAGAGEFIAQVDDDNGHPAADAVVALMPADPAVLATAAPSLWEPWQKGVIDQRDETFLPYVEIVARGGAVVFHNNDTPHHHVYSFSPIKSFEFVLAPGESSAPVLFDKPGIAAIGCNIHDQMIAYVYVTETPWVMRTDKTGRARIEGVPSGVFTAQFWHPLLKPGRPVPSQAVTISDTPATLAATLALLPSRHHDREHGLY
jgi:plastocyanin